MKDCLNIQSFANNFFHFLQKEAKVAPIIFKMIVCNSQYVVETREKINVKHFKKLPDLL